MMSFTKMIAIALVAAAVALPATTVNAWHWDKTLGACDCTGMQTYTYKCCYNGSCDDGTTCNNEGNPGPSPKTGSQACTAPASCSTPPPSASTGGHGGVVGDPQFTGLRGQEFQIHGVDGFVYNIISARDLSLNAKFTFLSSGKCPIRDGKRDTNCFSHSGSYLSQLGLKDAKANQYMIQSGDYKNGFASVTYNGAAVEVGQTKGDLQYVNTHEIKFHSKQFDFTFSNSDMFINQQIVLNMPVSQIKAHGLLGQTASGKTYPESKIKYIQGEVSDYVVEEGHVFGDNHVFNAYN